MDYNAESNNSLSCADLVKDLMSGMEGASVAPNTAAMNAAPASQSAYTAHSSSVEAPAPAVPNTAAMNAAPASQSAYTAHSSPVGATAPVASNAPATEAAPVGQSADSAYSSPAGAPAPVASNAPAKDVAPAGQSADPAYPSPAEVPPVAPNAPAKDVAPAGQSADPAYSSSAEAPTPVASNAAAINAAPAGQSAYPVYPSRTEAPTPVASNAPAMNAAPAGQYAYPAYSSSVEAPAPAVPNTAATNVAPARQYVDSAYPSPAGAPAPVAPNAAAMNVAPARQYVDSAYPSPAGAPAPVAPNTAAMNAAPAGQYVDPAYPSRNGAPVPAEWQAKYDELQSKLKEQDRRLQDQTERLRAQAEYMNALSACIQDLKNSQEQFVGELYSHIDALKQTSGDITNSQVALRKDMANKVGAISTDLSTKIESLRGELTTELTTKHSSLREFVDQLQASQVSDKEMLSERCSKLSRDQEALRDSQVGDKQQLLERCNKLEAATETLRGDMANKVATLGSELASNVASLRNELTSSITGLRTEEQQRAEQTRAGFEQQLTVVKRNMVDADDMLRNALNTFNSDVSTRLDEVGNAFKKLTDELNRQCQDARECVDRVKGQVDIAADRLVAMSQCDKKFTEGIANFLDYVQSEKYEQDVHFEEPGTQLNFSTDKYRKALSVIKNCQAYDEKKAAFTAEVRKNCQELSLELQHCIDYGKQIDYLLMLLRKRLILNSQELGAKLAKHMPEVLLAMVQCAQEQSLTDLVDFLTVGMAAGPLANIGYKFICPQKGDEFDGKYMESNGAPRATKDLAKKNTVLNCERVGLVVLSPTGEEIVYRTALVEYYQY